MRWQSRFLRSFGKVAIPNITAYWVAFQGMCMFMIWANEKFADMLLLDTGRIIHGEWWRLFTFLFMPASVNPVLALFVLYFYWMMGMALEQNWGTAKYNLYLLIGVVMNIGGAFLPLLAGKTGTGSNLYLLESVFLGFATYYPDYVIRIFFVLPVRIKWLALLTGIILTLHFGAALVFLDFTDAGMVIASVANYLLFFWRELFAMVAFSHKTMLRKAKWAGKVGPAEPAFVMHKCVVCGATERSAPQLEFRYCPACGGKCYCLEHLAGHPCLRA